MGNSEAVASLNGSEIAIIGMACRFPGAANVEEYWRNLCGGIESISFLSDDELEISAIDPAELSDPNYVKAASILGDADKFDASFFGVTPREAEVMDPQHRIFLECAWEALEHAGYNSETYDGAIGVFSGARTNTYLYNLVSNPNLLGSLGAFEVGLGNDLAFMSARVSYKLNLKGPSISVHTACSTSLVAVHLACQSLLNDECQMALAGGVAINVPQKTGHTYRNGSITSPDGHTRAFDAGAQGTIFGSGVGIVVLKQLEDALADRDAIYAVIKGSAINNDGSFKASFTAPSVYGQTEVILEALLNAEVEANTINYIETHGTGTALGDPIEIRALTKAFRYGADRRRFCAIGSVKTNFGHLDAAAGAAGLIKTALALKHKLIPASLHFHEPNPRIDFENSPFYVNTRLSPWEAWSTPRRAGVSAFGVGGTNAHVILEEAPERSPRASRRGWHLVTVSGRTERALEQGSRNLAAYLREHEGESLADVAYTLQVGRRGFSHRRVVVCQDSEEAARGLECEEGEIMVSEVKHGADRPVVFMFPGGGAQYINMGLDLYRTEPIFRQHVDSCCQRLLPLLGFDLLARIYPSKPPDEAAHQQFNRASVALPALFVIEYSLAQLWMSWGIRPQALIGHSLGEYVAACLAGVFSLEDVLSVVVLRGRLFERLPAGAMLSVGLSEAELRGLVNERLSIAAVNGPSQCVLSGSEEAVAAMAVELSRRGVEWRRLHIDVAAHSPLVEEILDEFEARLRGLELKEQEIGILSNLSGEWMKGGEASKAGYWRRHLREPVRFGQGIERLLQEPGRVLLEVGPGQGLSSLAKLQMEEERRQEVVSSMKHPSYPGADDQYLLRGLGRLWLAGVKVDWGEFHHGEQRARVALPTYPFERQRYWIEPGVDGAGVWRAKPGKKAELAEWFYMPSWKRTLRPKPLRAGKLKGGRRWLVFVDESGLGEAVVRRLREEGQEVVEVRGGEGFRREEAWSYRIAPRAAGDYQKLIQELVGSGQAPAEILHFWSVTLDRGEQSETNFFMSMQYAGCYSLHFLAQAISTRNILDPLNLWVITNEIHEVESQDAKCPEKATILGPCKVIPQEVPNIACRCVEMVLPKFLGQKMSKFVDQVLTEVTTDSPDVFVAYRGNSRWVQTYEPVRLESETNGVRSLRWNGVYLITGGLGAVGLLLAEYLVRTVGARLVLAGRSALPSKDDWERWLDSGENEEISLKIRKLQELENLGAEILVVAADVANEVQMRTVIAQIYDRFGELNGVLHAAGVTTGPSLFNPIKDLSPAEFEIQYRPKVFGVYVLEKVLTGKEIDFCILFSSNASVLGGMGFATYSAANNFMDAFATSREKRNHIPWISASWDPWPEETRKMIGVQTSMDQYTMTTEESAEAFRRVVCAIPEGHVIVATGDLPLRVDLWINRRSIHGAQDPDGGDSAATAYPRPMLRSVYVAPSNESEQTIANLWQRLLGVERVGIRDNFFDLGGHSLLAIRLVAHLRDVFHVDLPLRKLFEAPTVAGLAQAIEEFQELQREQEEKAALDLLAQLSEEEVDAEIMRRTLSPN